MKIEDGKGNGYLAGVSFRKRMEVESITAGILAFISIENGNAFVLRSDFVSLTTTNFSGIFYILNTSDKDLRITRIRTCGLTSQQWELIRNPTTGTLITSGTAITPQSLNHGSSSTFLGTVKTGAEGLNITDGDIEDQWINSTGHSIQEYDGSLIIPKGKSIALRCKPGASTTVCVSIQGFYSTSGQF